MSIKYKREILILKGNIKFMCCQRKKTFPPTAHTQTSDKRETHV